MLILIYLRFRADFSLFRQMNDNFFTRTLPSEWSSMESLHYLLILSFSLFELCGA